MQRIVVQLGTPADNQQLRNQLYDKHMFVSVTFNNFLLI